MGSLRSSCSPTPTASPTSKRWGPQPHLGAHTNAPRSSQAPALHVRRSLLGDARVPGPIRATWAAAGASGIGGGWGGGGRVRARPGQGRKAARAESRRTDVAQRHRGPWCHAPFWLDPGPACPLPLSSGHLGRMKGALGACGNTRCGSGDFSQTLVQDTLTPSVTLSVLLRAGVGAGWGRGGLFRQLLGCCPQEMPSWAVEMALFFHPPVQPTFHVCPCLPTS